MKYLSVCSGIEAASVAWHDLGWTPLAFSEIEAFPRAVLQHHYPNALLHGDFTVLRDQPWIVDADVLVGGTPCQAFSVAGLRNSLSDERGNLSLEFVRLADAIDNLRRMAGKDSTIIVWENVPGVLSVKDNAFGCFLAGLAGDVTPYVSPRGKWTNAGVVDGPARTVAWRILDAQYFGLAQRRRRVFVVASAREGFDPAAVLLEFDGLRRDTAPSREAGEVTAKSSGAGAAVSSGHGYWLDAEDRAATLRAQDSITKADTLISQPYAVGNTLTARMHKGINTTLDEGQTPVLAHSLRGEGFDASEDGTGRGDMGEVVNALNAQSGETGKGDAAPCVAFAQNTRDEVREMPYIGALAAEPGMKQTSYVRQEMAVRRLTPVECERLQGFPDNYTLIPWKKKPAADCPDGPRYKALGNSMAVPVMRWIGRRIANAIA